MRHIRRKCLTHTGTSHDIGMLILDLLNERHQFLIASSNIYRIHVICHLFDGLYNALSKELGKDIAND